MASPTASKASKPGPAASHEARSRKTERGPAAAAEADILALQDAVGNREVSRALDASPGNLPPAVQSVLNSGGGQPLDAATRLMMEKRFGRDFSRVRVHTDAQAAESARASAAKAYTVGRDIVFAEGRYAPGTGPGRQLLAHELAHVVQQSRGGPKPTLGSKGALEQGARQAAASINHGGGPVTVQGASAVGIARDEDEDLERRMAYEEDAERRHGRGGREQRRGGGRGQPPSDDDEMDERPKRSTKQRQPDRGRQAPQVRLDPAEQAEQDRRNQIADQQLTRREKSRQTEIKTRRKLEQMIEEARNQPSIPNAKNTALRLKRFEYLLSQSGLPVVRKNSLKGAYHESLNTSRAALKSGASQVIYVSGIPATRKRTKTPGGNELPSEEDLQPGKAHYANPDQSRAKKGRGRTHENMKSDRIDRLSLGQATSRAEDYLIQAYKNRAHLPPKEPVTIVFAHMPSRAVREAIRDKLLYKDSPVGRVIFGTAAYDNPHPATDTPRIPDETMDKYLRRNTRSRKGKPRSKKGPGTNAGKRGKGKGGKGSKGATAGKGGKGKGSARGGKSQTPTKDKHSAAAVPTVAAKKDDKKKPTGKPRAGRQAKPTNQPLPPAPPASAAPEVSAAPDAPATKKKPGRGASRRKPPDATTQETSAGQPSAATQATPPTKGTPTKPRAGRPRKKKGDEAPPQQAPAQVAPAQPAPPTPDAPATKKKPTRKPRTGRAGAQPSTEPVAATQEGSPQEGDLQQATATKKPPRRQTRRKDGDKPKDGAQNAPAAPTPAATQATPPTKGTPTKPRAGRPRKKKGDEAPPQQAPAQVAPAQPAPPTPDAPAPQKPPPPKAPPSRRTPPPQGPAAQRSPAPAPPVPARAAPPTRPPAKRHLRKKPAPPTAAASKTRPSFSGSGKTPPGDSEKAFTTSGSASRSTVAGPNKGGLSASVQARATQKLGKGVRAHQTVGAEGSITIETAEIFNTTPPKFHVTITINIGGKVGLGSSIERGQKGGSLSLSASGAFTASFSHEFTAEQMKEYLAAVEKRSGGSLKELKAIQMLAAGSTKDAKEYLGQVKATLGSAEGIRKHMAEGDEVELTTETGLGGGVSSSRSGPGGRGAGLEAEISQTSQVKRSIAYRNGKAILTISMAGETGSSVGGFFKQGVAGMGLARKNTKSDSQSVSFSLDLDDPNFDAKLSELSSTNTKEGLREMATRHPELVRSRTTGHGTSTTDTTSASIGPLAASMSEERGYNEEEIIDEEGVGHKYESYGGLGGPASVAGIEMASTSNRDTFVAIVRPDNTGTGETGSTTTETDWERTLKNAGQAPLQAIGRAITGETALEKRTDTQGKQLTDEGFAWLAEMSKDPRTWRQAWNGDDIDTLVDWMKARHKVLNANGDRNKISKAIAQFVGKGSGRGHTAETGILESWILSLDVSRGGGRSRTVETALGETGASFEFPDELADQKPLYDALVIGDPLAYPRELAAGDNKADAIANLNYTHAKLGRLLQGIQARQGQFKNPAIAADMTSRIGERRTQIRAEISKLAPPAAKAVAPLPAEFIGPPSAEQAEAAKQEEEAKRQERNSRIDDLVSTCQTNRETEQAYFAEVNAEYNKFFTNADPIVVTNKLNELKRMYEKWDQTVQKLRAVYEERGESADRANQFAPNRAQWQALYNKEFRTAK